MTARIECAPISDVRLDETEHLLSGLGHLHKHTIVDLKETKELKDFAGLGCDVVDTILTFEPCPMETVQIDNSPPDADNEINLRLRRDVEISRGARSPLQTDLLLLLRKVLLHVGLRALEDNLALGLGRLFCYG